MVGRSEYKLSSPGKGRSKSHDITSVVSTTRLGNICSNDRASYFAKSHGRIYDMICSDDINANMFCQRV